MRTCDCMSHPMTKISNIITLYSCDCHITLLVYIVVLLCANNITSLVLSHHLHSQAACENRTLFSLTHIIFCLFIKIPPDLNKSLNCSIMLNNSRKDMWHVSLVNIPPMSGHNP